MDIQRTMRRKAQHGRRQDQAVGGHHQAIGARACNARLRGFIFQGLGLEQLQAVRQRELLDGTWCRPQAAAGGPVRPRQNQRDGMAGVVQRGERALGEFRGAGEDEAQEGVRRTCAAAWRAWRARAAA